MRTADVRSPKTFASGDNGARPTSTNATPVRLSTIGYCAEMRLPHARHLPRRRNHEKTGMRSNHGISFLHDIHPLLPESGSTPERNTMTFTKLPTIRPNKPYITANMYAYYRTKTSTTFAKEAKVVLGASINYPLLPTALRSRS